MGKILIDSNRILAVILYTLLFGNSYANQSPPHIIFIYADDLGWNDCSFHGSPEIPTPNIDALAMSGILLNNYYGQWLCTPSRGSLLSGKHPIRLGLQHFLIKSGEATNLPLDIVTLPQHLKKLGYATHLIGKWHLGYMKKEYTPTYRGFDSFFGYYNGFIDYYDYTNLGGTNLEKSPFYFGIDVHNGTAVQKDFRGRYATEVFTEQAIEIIKKHDTNEPLFLYLAHAAVHTGLPQMPWQAPPKYINRVKYLADLYRKVMAGTMVALDDSVGEVFLALHRKGMLENSIIVFASDNGGLTDRSSYGASSNYPLRGQKQTLWEGALRLPALIWSPLLNLRVPRISKELMDVCDWLPTLYTAAGGNPRDLGDIDGLNMWEVFTSNKASPRTEILHNIDPIEGISALRKGDMKVVNGTYTNLSSWYNPTKQLVSMNNSNESLNDWVFKHGDLVRQILIQSGWWIIKDPDNWRRRATLTCTQPPPPGNGGCDPNESPCLFNIATDPCEYDNLASRLSEVVEEMMKSINDYQKTAVVPQSKPSDPSANPVCHGFAYVPWLDPEHYTPCAYG